MVQGIMDEIPFKPLTVCVSSSQNKFFHLPRHTAFGVALSSFAQIKTASPAALGMAKGKEKGETRHKETSRMDAAIAWEI